MEIAPDRARLGTRKTYPRFIQGRPTRYSPKRCQTHVQTGSNRSPNAAKSASSAPVDRRPIPAADNTHSTTIRSDPRHRLQPTEPTALTARRSASTICQASLGDLGNRTQQRPTKITNYVECLFHSIIRFEAEVKTEYRKSTGQSISAECFRGRVKTPENQRCST